MVINRKAKRKRLALAIGMALATATVYADFSPQFELSGLNGSNGFVINGVSAGDHSGVSVSVAGDINGDGISDLIIGAPYASTSADGAGASYVVFGSNQGLPSPLNLSGLDGSNGFVITGSSAYDNSGFSVSAAGDINGDGIDDLVIGAPGSSPDEAYSGTSYVVFGSEAWASSLSLSGLDGSNGFVINGVNAYDASGTSVSAAGDINGDGIDDLIIGAPYATTSADYTGAGYVVFGSEAWASSLNLSSLNGNNGFLINGVNSYDSLGDSVSAAGDINGDGIDDVIIGATLAGTIDNYAGASYVVFGSEAWASSLDLSSLDGTNGFVIKGVSDGDDSGTSVSAAGDINVDGIDDVIIGASFADPNGDGSGASYVVFGSEAWASSLNLSDLTGTNGFVINGVAAGDESGTSVSAAGDINVDGIDDVIIGASFADPNGDGSGASYVVFGSEAWASSLNLSGLNGTNGFVINGVSAGDNSGSSVSTAGDINGDGFDDLMTGAPLADPNGEKSGASYVVFGVGVDGDKIFSNSFE